MTALELAELIDAEEAADLAADAAEALYLADLDD